MGTLEWNVDGWGVVECQTLSRDLEFKPHLSTVPSCVLSKAHLLPRVLVNTPEAVAQSQHDRLGC